MKTIIQIHKEGKYFVASDLITNVADQGLTEGEALTNLKKGLEEHYQILMELAPKDQKISFLLHAPDKFTQGCILESEAVYGQRRARNFCNTRSK